MLKRRRIRLSQRTKRIVGACFATFFLWFSWSFGSFVLRDNGDSMAGRAVSWFRDHGLGPVVNMAEKIRYGKPPSKEAADDLGLSVKATSTTSSAATLAPTTTSTIPPTIAAPQAATTAPAPTIATTTIAPYKIPPPRLTERVTPPLDGEGVWVPIAQAGGIDSIWVSSSRPLPEYPSVVGSYAVMDQTFLRAAMFNGSDLPGEGDWKRGNRVPPELHPALRVGFNGGFRLEHIKGGFKTEGVLVRELIAGEATIAITPAGRMTIGEYGRDFTDDGTYISFRQNLPLIVDAGRSMVEERPGTWWGADYGDVIVVFRSAVCQMADGRIMYTAIGKVDAPLLAQSLVNLGCVRAIQMDINGTWPTYFSFPPNETGAPQPTLLDKRMGGGKGRYLQGSTREFLRGSIRPLSRPVRCSTDRPETARLATWILVLLVGVCS